MPDSPPRYEFRIWGDDLSALRRRIAASGTYQRSIESAEIYLLSRATDRCNAKIRDGLLDVKRLLGESCGLQQWMPILKASFPLDATALAACLSCLAIGMPAPVRSVDTADNFIREAIGASRLLVAASISKRREIFTLDGCIAEFAAVTVAAIPDTVLHTVAIESDDAERLLALAAGLGIGDLPNRSYVQELKRRLRVAPI